MELLNKALNIYEKSIQHKTATCIIRSKNCYYECYAKIIGKNIKCIHSAVKLINLQILRDFSDCMVNDWSASATYISIYIKSTNSTKLRKSSKQTQLSGKMPPPPFNNFPIMSEMFSQIWLQDYFDWMS